MRSWCIYMHTSPSGKVYIGQTCQKPTKRWQNGRGYLDSNNRHFYNAILRYGWNQFEHKILYTGLTQEEANEKEIELIKQYDSANPLKGYNQDYGGKGKGRCTEATKRKISESHKGEKNGMFGKHPANEHSKGATWMRGEGHPMYGKRGKDSPNYGRKNSEEIRRKMSINNPSNKAVRCVETGVIYRSTMEAQRQTGVCGNAIGGCCRHLEHYHTAGGFHWEWA